MSGEGKVTAIEKERRITTVIELIVKGADNREILHYIANETNWKINERQIYYYIKMAREHIAGLTSADIKHQIGLALKRMSRLIQKALTKENYSPFVVIAAQKEINELLGLYAPSKHMIAIADLTAKDHRDLSTIDGLDMDADFEKILESPKKLKEHK